MARILLLGGLDPSGGAGITADSSVVSLLGGEPLPIALATTVQSLRGFVRSEPIDAAVIREQVDLVLADGAVSAVKIGYVGSAEQVVAVAELLQSLRDDAKIIVDPVLSATVGGMSSSDDLVVAYRQHLVPCADLVTPNTLELDALADGRAHSLLELGAHAALHRAGTAKGLMLSMSYGLTILWPRICRFAFIVCASTVGPFAAPVVHWPVPLPRIWQAVFSSRMPVVLPVTGSVYCCHRSNHDRMAFRLCCRLVTHRDWCPV